MTPSPPIRSASRPKLFAAAASIFIFTLLAYLPAIRGGFIWDDDHYVTASRLRSLHGLWLVWSQVGATQQYFPLLHSAFWIEHRLWGNAAIGYHLANVLLHAGAACLLGLLLRRLAAPGAYLAALIFALHPVAVESVAWISEQKNTLSAVFFLAAALAYLAFDRQRSLSRYARASCLFALALATKTTTAPLPAALLVVFWWQRGRLSWRRDVLPLIPWFAAAAAAGLFSAWVEHSVVGAKGAAFALGPGERCLVAGRLVWFYLGKLFWPARLSFIYPRWIPETAAAGQWLFPAAAAAMTAVLWWARRLSRAPLAAWMYFVAMLGPVLGFLNVYWFIYSFAADHFEYLAAIGMISLAAAGWGRWQSRSAGPGAIAAAAVLCLLGGLTWRHSRDFADLETLYRTALGDNPASWLAQNNLGVLLRDSGRLPEATLHLREAVRLRPDAVSQCNLGAALAMEGRSEEAIAQYAEALRREPNYPGARYGLGVALAHAGRRPEAIAQYREVLRLKPDLPEVRVSLGYALADSGLRAEAIAQYREALRLSPSSPDAQYAWGNLLLNAGDFAGAMSHFEEALRLKPDHAQAHYDLGVALARAGRNPDAVAQYEQALRWRPDYPEAEDNLGAALAMEGRQAEAIAHYKRALRLKPDDPVAHYDLGLALQKMGRTAEAKQHFDKAARLRAAPP